MSRAATMRTHEAEEDPILKPFEYSKQNIIYVAGVNFNSEEIELFCSFLFDVMRALSLIHSKALCYPELIERFVPQRNRRGNPNRGYIHFFDPTDATRALRLDRIPFLHQRIAIERPDGCIDKDKIDFRQRYHKLNHWIVDPDNHKMNYNDHDHSKEELILVVKFDPSNKSRFCLNLAEKFVASALQQIGLLTREETMKQPCQFQRRGPGTHQFLEFLNPRDARNALRLQNLPYFNSKIRFERHYKFKGQRSLDIERNWEDSLRDSYYQNYSDTLEEEFQKNDLLRSRLTKSQNQNKDLQCYTRNFKIKETKYEENIENLLTKLEKVQESSLKRISDLENVNQALETIVRQHQQQQQIYSLKKNSDDEEEKAVLRKTITGLKESLKKVTQQLMHAEKISSITEELMTAKITKTGEALHDERNKRKILEQKLHDMRKNKVRKVINPASNFDARECSKRMVKE